MRRRKLRDLDTLADLMLTPPFVDEEQVREMWDRSSSRETRRRASEGGFTPLSAEERFTTPDDDDCIPF